MMVCWEHFVVVPKTSKQYNYYLNILKSSELHSQTLPYFESYDFIVVIQSQKTILAGDQVMDYILTSISQSFPVELNVEGSTADNLYLLNSMFRLINNIFKLTGRTEMFTLMFEICCKKAFDYKGNFHKELASNGEVEWKLSLFRRNF